MYNIKSCQYCHAILSVAMTCGNVPVENNANRFLLYPILRVSSSYTFKLVKSVNFIIYRCITSQNNKLLYHAVGSPMNLHYMGFLSPLTLMQHYRSRNNYSHHGHWYNEMLLLVCRKRWTWWSEWWCTFYVPFILKINLNHGAHYCHLL